MRLPWDRNYFKICFYIVFAFILGYILKLGIDMLVYTVVNMGDIYAGTTQGVLKVLSVFSALIWGFVISYILDPVVDFWQRIYEKIVYKGNKKSSERRAGTAITYICILTLIIILIKLLLDKVSSAGGSSFAESTSMQINGYTSELMGMYNNFLTALRDYGLYEYLSDYLFSIANWFSNMIKNISGSTINMLTTVGSSVVNVVLSLVIAFYLLKDRDKITVELTNISDVILSNKWRIRLYNVIDDVDAVFSGYIRGQLTDALIMAVLISVGLSLLKIRFAIIIGIISGFSNIIPYFGAIMGFVLAVVMALISGEPITALYAAILMLVLQQVDSLIIVPKVVGESVELSPVMVIIALAVAGKLFGLWGLILAVPVVAVGKIFLSRIYMRIKNNKEMGGEEDYGG